MKRGNWLFAILFSLSALVTLAPCAIARPLGHEAQAVVDTLLAPPTIKPEAGFTAKMLIPPGELYDPLFMLPRGDKVWMNDDGRATDGHGSRILAITPEGKIAVLMGAELAAALLEQGAAEILGNLAH